MFALAATVPRLRILSRTLVLEFEQGESRVRTVARDLDTNNTCEIFARYSVGCDGAHSKVRQQIGAALIGDNHVVQAQSTYIVAPGLLNMMSRPAWAIDCINPRACGLVFAIDGRERWLIHHFPRNDTSFSGPGENVFAAERHRSIREILGVGPSFEFEILGQEDWTGRRMLANRFRDRRVFLCGDAAQFGCPLRDTA